MARRNKKESSIDSQTQRVRQTRSKPCLRRNSMTILTNKSQRNPMIIHIRILKYLYVDPTKDHKANHQGKKTNCIEAFFPSINIIIEEQAIGTSRGKQSLETICFHLAYKIKYPHNFFLLRGNHECASTKWIYGFYDECKRRSNTFSDCFNCLPVAALIDEKILPFNDLNNLDQIRILKRPTDMTDSGLLYDFFWSDPCKDGINNRGVLYTFCANIVTKFLQKHDLDLVCHAHQVSISTLGFPCLCCSYHLKMINHLAFHAHRKKCI
ncbi:hypothetical protein OSB04_025793 [Centaurea solstitialis]|uniref:Serine/threonine-protein phosphatase n=1 Tax=Centaurea solstitialis TaxID=347529 RepID=A0AA38T0B7_9ASTR|nr:hypothetical protein OSB04_025793 [Centaurea solstitialis]